MGGQFITFEGGEGCGKSTQAAILAGRLGAATTREPGGTPLGQKIRALLLDPGSTEAPDSTAELLLYAADRAQHVATVIRPELDAGRHVICDRYTHSTVAYQGYGRRLDPRLIEQLNDVACAGTTPDLTVLLDVDAPTARARVDSRGQRDRLEDAGDAFHARVAAGFRALANSDPRIVVVDGTGTVDQVAARIWAAVTSRLPELAGAA